MKELPKTIDKRISIMSSLKQIFEKSKIKYEDALRNSHVRQDKYEKTIPWIKLNKLTKEKESAILFGTLSILG